MNESTVAGRIAGAPATVGANNSFFLDDPDQVCYVEKGFVDIFAAERDESGVLARQPHVGRLTEKFMAFGALPAPGNGGRSTCLMAVPSQGTVILRGSRATLADGPADLDLTVWVDNWINVLSQFLLRVTGKLPRDFRLIEADPDVPHPSGSVLTAQHLDIIWISANRPLRFSEFALPASGELLPLTEWTWVRIDEDAEVSGMYTPTALAVGKIWPALDFFNSLVLRSAEAIRRRMAEQGRNAHRQSGQARLNNVANMQHSLLSVLDREGAGRLAPTAAYGEATVLQAAAGRIIESAGGRLRIPRNRQENPNPIEEINWLARASGGYARRISLSPRWWRKGGPSFVGLTKGADRLLALISNRRGRYRMVDPETGTEAVVDKTRAESVLRRGLMFYVPLPRSIKSGLSGLVHVLGGLMGELRVLLATAVLSGLLALVTPFLTGKLLAEVVPRVDTPMWAAYLGALLMGALGSAMFEVVHTVTLLRVESRSEEHLQSAVWIRLLSLPARFFRRFTAGDLADRVNGVSQIRQLMAGLIASVIISGIFAVLSLAAMFYYSWKLSLCAAGLVLVLIAFSWLFARGQMSHQREAFRLQGFIDGLVFQMITGLAKLRTANAEHFVLRNWADRYARQKTETLAARRWNAAQLSFNSMFVPLAMIAIFASIQYILLEDEENLFGLADFLSFNALFGQFAIAMTAVTAAISTGVAAVPLFERIRPILEAEPESTGPGIDPGELVGDLEFANVSFRYLPDGPDAVSDLYFHIRPGERIAFVGASGSGKSTIYRLLLGFERPYAGSVFIDGYDLQTLDLTSLRSRMGVVLQDGNLTPASIYHNIAGGLTSATTQEVMEAARASGLAEDIEGMPMGIHTLLPEGDAGLSGGQRQRLLIARALVRNPRILLLDEATSALDNRTQEFVHSSLRALQGTLVMIAHRLSTIEDVDRIYVMDEGRIVEQGNFEDLITRDGVFAQLARRQLA